MLFSWRSLCQNQHRYRKELKSLLNRPHYLYITPSKSTSPSDKRLSDSFRPFPEYFFLPPINNLMYFVGKWRRKEDKRTEKNIWLNSRILWYLVQRIGLVMPWRWIFSWNRNTQNFDTLKSKFIVMMHNKYVMTCENLNVLYFNRWLITHISAWIGIIYYITSVIVTKLPPVLSD